MFNEICPPNSTQHVVKEGDTLWKLSQSYDVSVQNISDANPGINANNLQIGSILCIPANSISSTSPHTCPDRTFSYIVDSGDTLWKLSQAYGVSVQSILDVNPGIDPQNLQIGSTLCIPTAQTVPAPFVKTTPQTETAPPTKTAPLTSEILPVTCPKGTFRYTIQSGDTLWKLSQAYGVSVQNILDVNPGIDPQNLQIGSTLCIPTAQIVPAPFAKTTPPTKTAPLISTVPLTPAAPLTPTAPLISTVPLPPATPLTPTAPPTPTVPPTPATPQTPTVPQTTVASSRHFAYCVKKCDTICGIARKFYVSVESILKENPGINPRCLQAGTYIYVPINCCGENTWRYTVRVGDTLNRIANKLNVCPSALIAANSNIDFQHLRQCQVICIPKE